MALQSNTQGCVRDVLGCCSTMMSPAGAPGAAPGWFAPTT